MSKALYGVRVKRFSFQDWEVKDLTVNGDLIVAGDLKSANSITLQPSGDTDDYFTFSTVANIPTIYGTGSYVRIGDAAATSQSLASEDDLMVSGKMEVDGVLYADVGVTLGSDLNFSVSGAGINASNVDGRNFAFFARDSGVGLVSIAVIAGAADPYFQIGRDDTGVALNAVTDGLVLQAGAGTNNEAQNFGLGTSWKIGNASSEVEERGSIDLVLQTATNASEDASFVFSAMVAGAAPSAILAMGGYAGIQKVGFFGVAPTAKAAHIANSAGDDATAVNAILVVLENLGLVATS